MLLVLDWLYPIKQIAACTVHVEHGLLPGLSTCSANKAGVMFVLGSGVFGPVSDLKKESKQETPLTMCVNVLLLWKQCICNNVAHVAWQLVACMMDTHA